MRRIDDIIIHCSYTTPEQNIRAKDIRQWHVQDNGWRDIGYHHVICRDGIDEPGRPHSQMGAGVQGHNRYSIHICMVGGARRLSDGSIEPDCNFTLLQWHGLAARIAELRKLYPEAVVKGHRDFDNRACPTFDAATL
jgi:N-acetylmuramoyl-L-alanine amidase